MSGSDHRAAAMTAGDGQASIKSVRLTGQASRGDLENPLAVVQSFADTEGNKEAFMRSLSLTLAPLALLMPLGGVRADDAEDQKAALTALKKSLTATGLTFKERDRGNFSLTFTHEPKRSQVVSISAKFESFRALKVREIWSLAWVGKEAPSMEILQKVLLDHNKLGSWRLEKGKEEWRIYFSTTVPTDVSATVLADTVRLVEEVAEQMDVELNGEADAF
jgi:hypothetical protein